MAIREATKKALWFLDSFNVDLSTIILKSKSSDYKITLTYSNDESDPSLDTDTVDTVTTHPELLPCSKVDEILFLLDCFGVSDEFYHELSMSHQSLPRWHLIKQRRKSISSNIPINRLPQPYFGCYRSLSKYITEILTTFKEPIDSPVVVKISGDGAPFHRSTSYVLLSFSFPLIDKDALAAAGNHTFAVISGNEDYNLLKDGLSPVLEEVNSLIERPVLSVNDEEVHLSFVLGGDYKFLLLIMGMNAAHSNYACLYCKVTKNERYDTTITHEKRTLDSLKSCATKRAFGAIHSPLINISLDKIIIDELHLILRISDVLIRNLVNAAMAADCRITRDTTVCIDMLLQNIRKCGITFRVNYYFLCSQHV